MSKSMVGIGLGLSSKGQKFKKNPPPESSQGGDDYSNDDFESMSISKSMTISGSNKIALKKGKVNPI